MDRLFRNVLVGWDGSAAAAEALTAALTIAGPRGNVVALSIVRQSRDPGVNACADNELPGLQDQAFMVFSRVRLDGADTAGVRMSAVLIVGDATKAGPAVCAYAADHGFEMIVLGRHGASGAPQHLGRVARAALLASPVPVLLIGGR